MNFNTSFAGVSGVIGIVSAAFTQFNCIAVHANRSPQERLSPSFGGKGKLHRRQDDSSGTAAAPEADAAPGSPRITGSIPLGAPNKNSPPEPYWAPTWDEVSGQDAPPQTGEKP